MATFDKETDALLDKSIEEEVHTLDVQVLEAGEETGYSKFARKHKRAVSAMGVDEEMSV